MLRRATLAPFAAILLLAACASAGSERQTTISNRDVLTLDQLQETHATNVYEAVQRTRSQWLRPHGPTIGSGAAGVTARVYLDDRQLGGLDELRRIEIAMVQYVRFYREAEAASRWGRAAGSAPVIYVSTRPLTQ